MSLAVDERRHPPAIRRPEDAQVRLTVVNSTLPRCATSSRDGRLLPRAAMAARGEPSDSL
jgi:hypothetical protein